MSKAINSNKTQQGNLSVKTRQDLIFNQVQTYTQESNIGKPFCKDTNGWILF